LAKVCDAFALREAIRRVLNNRETWSQLSANCRRVAVEEYSLELQATRYERLYRTILEAQAEAQLNAALQPPGPCMA
jgi:glycosyltransferase involved in cell wall biosynthesis